MALHTNCCLSTLKNTSGGSRVFSFLPPHGRTLANAEEITVFGNILEAIQRGTAGTSPRVTDAFLAALDTQQLDIINTPSPILYDTDDDDSRMLALSNDKLFAVDTCWMGSSSNAL